MHKCHMVMDFQFGSTGKGLLAGYLARRESYDTATCSFATNAGHTYIDKERNIHMMTQQLPTAISSPTVSRVMIGPGALVHLPTLFAEMDRYANMLKGKTIYIHPRAAIVTDEHAEHEKISGMSKIGSTTKGVGAAMIQRIRRNPRHMNVADEHRQELGLRGIVVSDKLYRAAMEKAESIIIEGAQGFSLSMYHGFYPYTTSRDVTPWQIAADCGLPFKWASKIQIFGTLRTYPIRVNNRDGGSGPGYPDQPEITWESIGQAPELTTVTKLPRRIFEFSEQQLEEAIWHCGGYWQTMLFLNFANYHGEDKTKTEELIRRIESRSGPYRLNPPKVILIGYGDDDANIVPRELNFDDWPTDQGGAS